MMKHISCIFVLCMLLQLSRQSDASEEFLKCFPNNKLSATDPQSISAKLAKSRLQFSIDFTKNVLKRSKAGANVFFSPHSVYQALMLALFISNNHTENSLKTVLRLPADIVSVIINLLSCVREKTRSRCINIMIQLRKYKEKRAYQIQTCTGSFSSCADLHILGVQYQVLSAMIVLFYFLGIGDLGSRKIVAWKNTSSNGI